jgi:catechol 2,3-dioxygenase-like lactoylglutathione lyase family enzyme
MTPDGNGAVRGFDHVSLPMQDTDAMVAFYRSLGLDVAEHPHVVSVYAGDQMINLHRPETWHRKDFTLRAPAATPPCGDLCFVWEGSRESLHTTLEQAGAEIEEGPVERQGGRRAVVSSVYVRDPDGNLLEFMIYSTDGRQGRSGAG